MGSALCRTSSVHLAPMMPACAGGLRGASRSKGFRMPAGDRLIAMLKVCVLNILARHGLTGLLFFTPVAGLAYSHSVVNQLPYPVNVIGYTWGVGPCCSTWHYIKLPGNGGVADNWHRTGWVQGIEIFKANPDGSNGQSLGEWLCYAPLSFYMKDGGKNIGQVYDSTQRGLPQNCNWVIDATGIFMWGSYAGYDCKVYMTYGTIIPPSE